MSGFHCTWLYPYDQSAVPLSACAPSTLTERSHILSDQVNILKEFDTDDECSLAVLKQWLRNSKKQKGNLNKFFHELMATSALVKSSSQA